tara:strand:+ start:2945 stop:3250 length:306 start_codon:yes stop_codon:yes gene_type:complete
MGKNDDKTFNEYYQYYLTLHQNKVNRWLHIVGQCVTILTLVAIIKTSMWILLPIVPFVVYPFAWFGHLVFEKNEPAAWTNPLWAKACDWIMLKDVLTGKLK